MSNKAQDTINQEMSAYKILGSLDQRDMVATNDLSNVISALRSDLSTKLDCDTGKPVINGTITALSGIKTSGDIEIHGHSIRILSGNYVQTTDAENVINYSPKNSFLQAERAKDTYPIASTGSKGYCVIEMIMPNQLRLSSMEEPDEFLPLINHKDKLWSLAIGSTHKSQMLSIDSVDGNVVTFAENFDGELAKLSSKTTDEFIQMFYTDDNALFQNEFPNEGNVVIQNFYGNHAEGGSVRAIGKYSHAEGRNTIAEGRYSHTEGSHNTSGGVASHTEGMYCFARGQRSHAECSNTSAFGHYSHAEGYYTKAAGQTSHAEGGNTESNGNYSHAEGQYTYADGWGSHTCGVKSHALRNHHSSFVWQGYNKADTNAIQKLSEYESNAIGSFNINPVNGLEGFYIGDTNLSSTLTNIKADIKTDYTDKISNLKEQLTSKLSAVKSLSTLTLDSSIEAVGISAVISLRDILSSLIGVLSEG